MTSKEKAVDSYIREKHTQEECIGFIDGYEKCQQDIYTEKDMINALLFGMQKGLNVGKIDETDNDWVNNYIKSLNKGD